MKTLILNRIILLSIGLLVFNSCVEDDFDAPDVSITDPVFPENARFTTVNAIVGQLVQNNNNNVAYDDEVDYFMEGYIISSDEGGNFFEELIIQDRAEDPTAGLRFRIDVNPLFVRYEFGRKVYIRLDGLSIGLENGVATLGRPDGDDIGQVPGPLELETIFRTSELANIVPLEVSLDALSGDMTNIYVTLTDVQFSVSDVISQNLTYASEPTDQFDGERTLVSCGVNADIVFATSTFADFAGLSLPTGRGNVEGVLTRNFFGDTFNIVVNSPEGINFDSDQRCDPVFLQDFQAAVDNQVFDFDGWINFAEEGSALWIEEVFQGNGAARFTAFNSGDNSNIGWLITPPIDFDAQDGEMLSFEMQHAFPDTGHDPISVLISTDFDGTEAGVTTATWTDLGDFTKSYIVDPGEWFTYVNSSEFDLSNISGNAYIAFRYTGSDTNNQNMTIDIDNISINVP